MSLGGGRQTNDRAIGRPHRGGPTLLGNYPEGGRDGRLQAIAKNVSAWYPVDICPGLIRREARSCLHVSPARPARTSGTQPRPPGCAPVGLGGLGFVCAVSGPPM